MITQRLQYRESLKPKVTNDEKNKIELVSNL